MVVTGADWLSFVGPLAALAWLGLLALRGGFWRADQRLTAPSVPPTPAPQVVAVIPARDEAATVATTVRSLLGQDYDGDLAVLVVDDGSRDGTAERARAAGDAARLRVIAAAALPPGWSGKVWAMHQGLGQADRDRPDAAFVLFADADIEFAPDTIGRLVAKAETEGRDLVSLMVRLRCLSAWERLLVPAFVFFFQKLYPFARVNDPRRPEAAAAGGCMLVRRAALARAGGLEAIRDRVIDDCALASLIKRSGSIWLGLSECDRSLRGHERLAGLWRTVTRTAFVQLRHSIGLLAATTAGMAFLYLVPPAWCIVGLAVGDAVAAVGGLVAWAAMATAYRPTVRLYGQPGWRAWLLPAAACLFVLMTVDSARRSWLGRGAAWKGRHYDAGGVRLG